MNIDRLKGKMVEKGLNVERFAEIIGTNRASLYRKLKEAEKISIGEAIRMKEALGLTATEATEIFFSQTVARDATSKGERTHE